MLPTRFKGEKKRILMPVVGGVILFFPIRHSVPGIPGGRLEWDFYLSPLKPLKMLRRRVREIPILSPSHPTPPDSPFPRGRDSHMLFPALHFLTLRSSLKKNHSSVPLHTALFSSLLFGSTNISTFSPFCVRALLLLCRRRRRRRRVAQTVIG